jgi:hypothetical protein
MRNDITLTLAILCKLELLTKQEAKEIYGELEYINIPMEFEGCYEIINGIFNTLRVGKLKKGRDIVVDGKTVHLVE